MATWLSAALAITLMTQTAPAASEPGDTTVESVVVTGKRAPDQQVLADFITDVSAPTSGRLSRWDRRICVGVIGMKPAYAQILIDRVGEVATTAGLEPGESGCRPNLIVVGTDNSDALVKSAVADNPDGFAKYESELTAGHKALNAFLTSSAPVRWWHVSARVMADGQRYQRGDQVRARGVSRIKGNTRSDFDRALIVLDVKRIGSANVTALADYIAMVGLAQIDPDARIDEAPTILNLFRDRDAGRPPVEALTDWDKAYLAGLYSARRDALRGRQQERDIVRSMAKDLSSPPKKD